MRRKRTALPEDPKRNRAFANALARAKSYAKDPKALRASFEQVVRKTGSIPKAPFKDLWSYFQVMLRLIRAYYRGDYRDVRITNLVVIIGAIIYVLDPWDLIPDWIPVLGFVDDATIVAFAVQKTRETLDDFTAWETRAP
ncbi:MAG TPA: YkvA family protein [Chthoniobacterales bacterium]|nr:YkvA family protein [Chthoniobacterales bacterium]